MILYKFIILFLRIINQKLLYLMMVMRLIWVFFMGNLRKIILKNQYYVILENSAV